jgi:outer membrane protein TolC
VALGDLARATGLPAEAVTADALVGLALAVPEPPARDAVLARLDAESPALRRAREELAAAEAAVRLARAEDRPKLRGDAEWLEFGSSAGDFSGEWRAGLRVAVPLYRGGATAARVARAEAARDAAAAAEDAALLGLEEAIDRALAAAAEAAARAASLVEAEEALREVVRVERLRLAAGAGVEADYLEAEADLLAARARLAEARHAELVARAELARAAGALDEGWVERELVARPPEAGPREGEVP